MTKQFDPDTEQRSLLFEIDYPDIEQGERPRHRVMSAFEQKVEACDKRYQYLLVAAEPYETIAFKIPNVEIDKSEGRFFTDWDPDFKAFVLQIHFRAYAQMHTSTNIAPPPSKGARVALKTHWYFSFSLLVSETLLQYVRAMTFVVIFTLSFPRP